jgi:glycosyltransferase involved in cell wall biosynthesis
VPDNRAVTGESGPRHDGIGVIKGHTVLHVISCSELGGAQILLASLAQEAWDRNIRLVVACPPGPLLQTLKSKGVEAYALAWGFLVSVQIASLIRATRARIVHMHLLGAGMHGCIASFLTKGPQLVFTAHNPVVYPGMGIWKKYLHTLVFRLVARRVRRIVAVSNAIRESLVELADIPETRIKLIHNGIAFAEMERAASDSGDVRAKLGLPTPLVLLGAVGRITYAKAHDVLLEALSLLADEFPSLHCVIVGDGDLRTSMERLAHELRVEDRAHFVGFKPDVLSWYRAMDIVVLSSRFEGFLLTVLEAAYAEKPIVCTDVGVVGEVLEDRVSGLIVPPEDPVALAEAIRRLLREPTFAAGLAARAREAAVAHFDIKRCREQTAQLYDELFHFDDRLAT